MTSTRATPSSATVDVLVARPGFDAAELTRMARQVAAAARG
ncbi:MAG: hypothetical protein ACRDTC_05630 [Pseudonocardiaceae bacterium]